MSVQFEKETSRQDQAIDRLADRTVPLSEVSRVIERLRTAEKKIEGLGEELHQMGYKVRITWAAGSGVAGIILTLLIAYAEKWIGGG